MPLAVAMQWTEQELLACSDIYLEEMAREMKREARAAKRRAQQHD